MLEGALLVNKPVSWTSFDVVNYVRRIAANHQGVKPKSIKVGHTGTLDPFASGLLVLLVGKNYTRRAEELSKLDKTYEVVMELGATSSTGDPEGEIVPVNENIPSRADVDKAVKGYVGEIDQIPPAFSAIKVNGVRSYKLARSGKEVILEARKVRIDEIKIDSYNYPDIKFKTRVSSGTYIRSLVEDIGTSLSTGAYTKQLVRKDVERFKLDDAIDPREINLDNIEQLLFNPFR